ncbi:MAG: hypothetical protein P1P81_01460 [Desulfobulbales bacterium]|nr:hypothetical protein [Desulfobulbales bacterium]
MAGATLTIHAQQSDGVELVGFDSLAETSLFKGDVSTDGGKEIKTPHRGLALLVFPAGRSYPVIIGDTSFTLGIATPAAPPTFKDSGENDFFYRLLAGAESTPKQNYRFAKLMIRAKQLLESTHSVRSVVELTAKKTEIHDFVRTNYEDLKHSDMIRRLIAQYFMMHEYVQYHFEGRPATDIKKRYDAAVLGGVGSWLDILSPYLSKPEILNYCVSLYYDRSMVSLASLIMEKYRDYAFCASEQQKPMVFPGETKVTDISGQVQGTLADYNGNKVIAFVAKDCPVSMVVAVSKARELSDQKGTVPLIVAAVEKLSAQHLAMAKMVRGERMLFIDDGGWRESSLPEKIRLPLFVEIEEK